MTNPRTAEASASSGRPVTLYKFQLFAEIDPVIPGEDATLEDSMAYVDRPAMESNDWDFSDFDSSGTNVNIEFPGGFFQFHITIAGGPPAIIQRSWSGLTPGSTAYCIFDWYADGHWFEPASLTILSGASSKSRGVNPPLGSASNFGTKQTGSITIDGSGTLTLKLKCNGGYPTIAHNDTYEFKNIRIFVLAPDVEPPPEDIPSIGRTSFRRTVTYEELDYTPCEIEHTEPSQGVDDAPGTIQISLPADDPIALEFQKAIPPARPMVIIYQYHRPPVDEPDPANVWSMLYDIVDTEHTPDQTILTCSSILAQTEMVIPSGLIQRDYCMWATYDPETCAVDPAPFTFVSTVSAIDGTIVTVSGADEFSDDPSFFRLGDLSFGNRHSMIREQSGEVMLLDDVIPDLGIGDEVTLIAGDDRTETTCQEKFANSLRRASFSKMPIANPYYGRGLAP